MSHSHTTPLKIPHVKATFEPIGYINQGYSTNKTVMTTSPRKPVISRLARLLMCMYEDLPMEEIYAIEDIMKENGERDPECWLVDQITNWVYEDTEVLMPVAEAYRMVKQGWLNE